MLSYIAESSTYGYGFFFFLRTAVPEYLALHATVARIILHARALASAHYTCARELRITEDRVRR